MFDQTVVVGLGGIGSALVEPIARISAYSDLAPRKIVLVDGEKYEEKNRVRQSMGEEDEGKPKVAVHADLLRRRFKGLDIMSVQRYLAAMPKEDDSIGISSVIRDRSIVLTGLDNDDARLLISEHARTLKDVIVINGGNLLWDGHAHVYLVMDGIERTSRLEDLYPLSPDARSRNPGDLSCLERQALPGGVQVLSTNLMVAAWMTAMFTRVVNSLTGKEALAGEFKRNTEVIFDVGQKMSAVPYTHVKRVPKNLMERKA